MSLLLSSLQELNAGLFDPIRVGEIRFDTAQKLGLKNHGTYLSKISLDHIFFKHKDVTYYDLQCIPLALAKGLVVQEIQKPHVLLCSYENPVNGKRYICSMKVITAKTEVWITSFYRSDIGQTKKLLERGIVIQTHR
ncbi:MAG: hypothetical protein ABI230_02250 [Aestuariivirga sp.]